VIVVTEAADAVEDAALSRAERTLMDALFSDAGRNDPHAALAVASIPGCRHAFVHDVLHDPRFVAPDVPPSPDLIFQVLARFLPRLEPVRHRALRAPFAGLFTPRRVERYRERISQRVAALIGDLQPQGSADLVSGFAGPLPFTVIAEVLGVPADRHAWLAEATAELGRGFAGQRDHTLVERANTAATDMLTYFAQALDERAVHPRDDLLSLLATAAQSEAARDDVLANCIFFLLAGHATTTTLLAAAVMLLAEHPDQLDNLLTAPVGWPTAIEEVLRYVSPTTLTGAKATSDVEIDGYRFAAGQHRILAYAAANRDPRVFADPDRFDATRAPNPHLAFSAGAHFCLGAPLARLHAEIALPALFTRLPGLRLAGPPQWRGSAPVRQIETMQVQWHT
jgi:pimeloyl-[acyl-carrier protein] synthase